jgi:anti-sigma regulatory factor (Ser/Thr protein kinase)
VAVTEASQVGEARRAAATLTAALGFDDNAAGKAALVVTEIATNLARHARDGRLLLRPLQEHDIAGLEVLALDRGPGMSDIALCRRDGFSTTDSPGTGLGAIARLSGFLDVFSRRPGGTALLARLWPSPVPPTPHRLHVGAVCVPRPGESVCGDAWAIIEEGGRAWLLVADGLGHGPEAAIASREAVRVFHDTIRRGPAEVLRAAHAALRSTRGAACAVAELDLDNASLRHAGVGNIAGSIVTAEGSRGLVSHNGTIGHQAHKFTEFTYPFPPGALLVMHSDGLTARWSLDAYSGLLAHDPGLIAGVLYRDFDRGRDDATVLAIRAVPAEDRP